MEVTGGAEGLKALAGDWEDLFGRLPGRTVFQSFPWNREVARAFGRQNEMRLHVFRDGRGVAGIIPLRSVRRRLGPASYRALEFLTHNRADYQDLVVSREREACLRLLVERFRNGRESGNLLYLRNVPETSATPEALEAAAGEAGLRCHRAPGVICPVIDLAEGREAYLRRLQGKLLGDLDRCERRLSERGSLEARRYEGEEPAARMAETFMELHVKRWGRTSTPSKFLRDEHRLYFTGLFESLHRSGLLDLHYLSLDGKPLALQFNTCLDGTVWFHGPAFDPDYARFSPGKLLLRKVIEASFSLGRKRFDFLAGREAYKLQWANGERRTTDLAVFSGTASRLVFDAFFNAGTMKGLSRFKRTL